MAIERLITDHLDLWAAAVRPKSSAGRGNNSKLELTGIKKLRELILELAVRGKLVPQDPSDEPASVLLERISAEKARLVKEGKIKKPKALPEISEDEKPFALPEGWEWSMLAEIAAINPRNESDDAVDASFVPMSLISTSYNGQHEFEARKWGEIKKGFTHFASGDIGIAKITPCFENSKAAVFRGLINGIGAGTTELHIARPYTDYVSALFILLNIKSPIYLKKGEAGMTGTAGQKRLAKDFFSFYPLPIPPFSEQHRIVAKVDELMALCDQLEQRSEDQLTAHQTLVDTLLSTLTDSADADELAQNWTRLSTHFDTIFATEASIDYLKQTILQLAVMGKLVPQDPSDEPASALLERIATEKSILIKKGEIKKSLSTDSVIMDNCNWALSSGWSSVELQNIFRFIDYRGKNPEKSSHGVRLITAKNIRNGVIKNEPVEYVSKELYDEWMVRGFPKKRDILFITEGHTMGFVAQVHLDFKFALAQRTICLQPYSEIVPEYLLIALMTMQFQKSVKDNETGSAAGGIKASKLKRLLLPIPPLEEQTRIVSKAERLLSLCDQLKSRLQTSQQTQLALAESLVEGALA